MAKGEEGCRFSTITKKLTNKLHTQYDYIIAGAGCAGLSLLMRMLEDPFFQHRKILLVDKTPKNTNDRTWCFWEKNEGYFDEIVLHKWKNLHFKSPLFSKILPISPYEYKMIRGEDFYNFCFSKITASTNVQVVYGAIAKVQNVQDGAIAVVGDNTYKASYIFTSILSEPIPKDDAKILNLLQHFKGWVIETENQFFDIDTATFMDFTVPQTNGTTFVYVLPITNRKALVEYTLFTEKLLTEAEYNEALKAYISKELRIEKYTVVESEFGIIPMTNFTFSLGENNIVNIGTVSGKTKASSGYTFQFIQKHSQAIIRQLKQGKDPKIEASFWDKRFALYDATLLHVIHQKKWTGAPLFGTFFKRNSTKNIFAFLDNESSIWQELSILNSMPMHIFLPSALKEMIKKIR